MRPTKDQYMMKMARAAGSRATCNRGKSGAIIAVDGVVVSSGYVGAARGLPHCDEAGHLMREVIYEDGSKHRHCFRSAHAEGNAIVQAAKRVVGGGTLYCKMEPCLRCTVDLINAGIKRVVADYRYHGAELSRKWLAMAGVALDVVHDEDAPYDSSEPEVSNVRKLCEAAMLNLKDGEHEYAGVLLEQAIKACGEEGEEGT